MTIHDVEVLLPNLVTLGWIVLFGVVLWRFGQPLSEVLGRLRRGKVAGFEIELNEVKKELTQLEIVQSLPLAQLGPPLTQALPATPTEVAAESDAFTTFVAALLDLASRAPEAALIRLRVELEQSMSELRSLLRTPTAMDPIKQLANVLDADKVKAVLDNYQVTTAKSEEMVKRYLELCQHFFSHAASAPNAHDHAIVFGIIDIGITMLESIEKTQSQLLTLSELAAQRPVSDA